MFTSYAQNFEDVFLWRALKDAPNGFYVDIGAQDPRIDSVSRGFYEQGWRGVSIEPTQAYADKLRADRPDEKVVQAAVGQGCGAIKFYEFPDTGLSTADSAIAQSHKANGFRCVETQVPVLSLGQVLRETERQDVHWLKVDVEGREGDVFGSWGDCGIRPWIVVAESVAPLARTPTHAAWEPELVERGYRFVYFDGVNRYYLSNAHQELALFFGPGPNLFDKFTLAEDAAPAFALGAALRAARAQTNLLRSQRDAAAARTAALEREVDVLAGELAEAERLLAATRASASWRMTASLRVTSRAARGHFEALKRFAGGQATVAKRLLRAGLTQVADHARQRPALKSAMIAALNVAPPLRERLRLAMQRERSERAAIQGLSIYALNVEPKQIDEWRALLQSSSDGSIS